MSFGPGELALWPLGIGPRDPRYDDRADIAEEEALDQIDNIQAQLFIAETALHKRAWGAYREAIGKANKIMNEMS